MVVTTSTIAPAEYKPSTSINNIKQTTTINVPALFQAPVSTSSIASVSTSSLASVSTSSLAPVSTSSLASVSTSYLAPVSTSSLAPVSTSSKALVSTNNIIYEDYTLSAGYRSALGMYSCLGVIFGCSLLSILFQSNLMVFFAFIAFIVFIVCCAFSIENNRIKMEINKYFNKDKYYTFINASWIFPTILLLLFSIGLVTAFITFIIVKLNKK